MMKKSYILIALGILACLCVIGYIDYGDTIQEGLTNKKSKQSSLETSEEWESQRSKDQIASEVRFNPTMELTDEIINATLEELIIKDVSTQDELSEYRQLFKESRETTSEYRDRLRYSPSEIHLKYVSVNSNIAKIYFLQNPKGFCEHNSAYYNQCVEKVRHRIELEERMQNMKKWSNYD